MKKTISNLDSEELRLSLRTTGVRLRSGPFVYRITSPIEVVAQGLEVLYSDFPLLGDDSYVDFNVAIAPPWFLRRWFRPKIDFYFDYQAPFKSLPVQQSFAFLEWGMNWCISTFANQHLKIHAAVLERGGKALIMPGVPGAGKSTLCAALMYRGWRLLSDEHTLIDETNLVVPLGRPVSLKNKSIDVISEFESGCVKGPRSIDTHKGDVVHLKPTKESIVRIDEKAYPCWIVSPRYIEGSETKLVQVSKSDTFMSVAAQSFNYNLLGEKGFEMMSVLVDSCECYELSYSSLDEAIKTFDMLENAI